MRFPRVQRQQQRYIVPSAHVARALFIYSLCYKWTILEFIRSRKQSLLYADFCPPARAYTHTRDGAYRYIHFARIICAADLHRAAVCVCVLRFHARTPLCVCVYTYRELKVMIDSYRNAITGECPLSRRVYYSPQGYCIRVSACVRRKKKDGRDIGWCIFDDFRVSILSLSARFWLAWIRDYLLRS